MLPRLRRLGDEAAVAAWLLGGVLGRRWPREVLEGPAGQERGRALVSWLSARRLAAEVSALPRLDEAAWPAAVRRALAVERARVGALAALQRQTIEACGERLARHGVPALLYKGAAVIELTHGDASRRPMADVDLVVGAADRAAARAALLEAGLVPTCFDTPLHDVLVDATRRGPAAPRGIAVELHADVFPPPHPFAIDVVDVLAGATGSTARGLLLPSLPHALLLAAFHVALYENDGSKGLLALRDVALLAHAARDRGAVEAALAEAADRWGLQAVTWQVGVRAVAWAGAPPWLAELPPGRARSSVRRRIALRLALAELDATIASRAPVAPSRALGRRLSSALWHEDLAVSIASSWRGLVGGSEDRGVAHAARVVARHAAAAARSLRGPRSGAP